MSGHRLKVAVLLVAAVVLHQSFFATVRLGDVQPQVMLLVAVAAAIVGGPERGAVIGFSAGLLSDVLVRTPLGLSALTFSLVAFGVGFVYSSVIRSAWWMAPTTAFVASAAGICLYALLGALMGQAHFVRPAMLVAAGLVGAVNALLAPLAVRAMSWAMAGGADRSYAR